MIKLLQKGGIKERKKWVWPFPTKVWFWRKNECLHLIQNHEKPPSQSIFLNFNISQMMFQVPNFQQLLRVPLGELHLNKLICVTRYLSKHFGKNLFQDFGNIQYTWRNKLLENKTATIHNSEGNHFVLRRANKN